MHRVRTVRSARSACCRKAFRSPAVRYLRPPSAVCSCMPVCGARAAGLAGRLAIAFGAIARTGPFGVLVPGRGQTIDFLLSAKRDAEAAKRFFRKALAQPHTVNPRTITVDKNAAYPKATAEMKTNGERWWRSRLRQVKYLNNIVEQDHRGVKRLTGPGLGFGSFWTARRTIAGYEAMAMIRKAQVRSIGGRDIRAQAEFIAGLFPTAA